MTPQPKYTLQIPEWIIKEQEAYKGYIDELTSLNTMLKIQQQDTILKFHIRPCPAWMPQVLYRWLLKQIIIDFKRFENYDPNL